MSTETLRKYATALIFWSIFAIYSAAESHYRTSLSHKPYSWARALLSESGYCLIWAIFTPAVLWLAEFFRIEQKRLLRNTSLHLAASVCFSVTAMTLWALVFQRTGPWAIVPFSWPKYLMSVSGGFTEGLTLYWLIILVSYAWDYHRKYQQGLVQAARLQTQLVQAQLQTLKMQLHPHFLFNTLHSISALMHEDAEAADTMIMRLAELLRLSLDHGAAHQVTIRQELRFLDLYLAIEKVRFEDRLEVQFRIAPDTEDALIPNMILQPLVENSIRHGIANRVEVGRISISSEREGDKLVVKVTDNGAGLSSYAVTALKEGVGLGATRGRLARLYGNGQSLILRNLPAGGAEAVISIPFLTVLEEADAQNQYANHR